MTEMYVTLTKEGSPKIWGILHPSRNTAGQAVPRIQDDGGECH